VNSPHHQQILRRRNPDFANYPDPARLQNQLSFQKDYFLFARYPPTLAVLSGFASFLRGVRTLVFPSLLLDPVTSPLPNSTRFVSTTD
jgi:hypothetical protein